MSKNIEKLYLPIGQKIFDALPDFSDAWFSMEISDDVWGGEVFFRDKDGQIKYINEDLSDIEDLFLQMRDEFKKIGKQPFTTATFYLKETGKFKINFGYEDVSDFGQASKRRKVWIKEYLGDNAEIQWS